MTETEVAEQTAQCRVAQQRVQIIGADAELIDQIAQFVDPGQVTQVQAGGQPQVAEAECIQQVDQVEVYVRRSASGARIPLNAGISMMPPNRLTLSAPLSPAFKMVAVPS